MVTLRSFDNIVKHIDSFLNFVFAVDYNGLLTVFLLSEEIKEIDSDDSDDERPKFVKESIQLNSEPMFMKYYPDMAKLVVVTAHHITTLMVEQIDALDFKLTQVQ
jgi:hypothetical protein